MTAYKGVIIPNTLLYGIVSYGTLSGTIRDAAEELIPGVIDVDVVGEDGFHVDEIISTDGNFTKTIKGGPQSTFRLSLRSDEDGNSPEVFDDVKLYFG
jgi:hypothetical protein